MSVPEGVDEGSHQVRVRARNAAGLESEVAWTYLVVDLSPPALAIVHPVDGAVIPQKGLDVLLLVEVDDPNRVSRVSYGVDGSEPVDLPEEEISTTITLDEFGEHTVEVTAEDTAGNVATVTSTFLLEDSSAHVSEGVSLVTLAALVALAAAGTLAYGVARVRRPGLRTRRVLPGDGWHEEWTAPHLTDLDEEGALEEGAEGPGTVEAPPDDAAEEGGKDLSTGEELEPVELPSDWEEFERP